MSIQAVSQNTVQIAGQPVTSNPASSSSAQASSTSASSATGSGSASTSTSSKAPTSSYSVTISSAARALLQETTETSVQTAQEAAKGDLQAQRLLAKETAATAK